MTDKLLLDNFHTSNYTTSMPEMQDKQPRTDEMTTGQAARLLGVAIQTIHNWINGGKLEARQVWQGRKRVRYVQRASVERMQDELRQLLSGR